VADLDREAGSPASGCLEISILGQRVADGLAPTERQRVDAHLDECLACLNAITELRDSLHGVAVAGPVSPGLRQTLDGLIGQEPPERFWEWVVGGLRRGFGFRVPVWAVAGAAAAVLLGWVAVHELERGSRQAEQSAKNGDRLAPAHFQTARTISGVVSSVRDTTSNGVEAYIVSLRDTRGATYVLFAWGPPTVHSGERVEIDGVFTSASQDTGDAVYQGVATALRPAGSVE
jgi:hypothetical protein